MAENKRSSNVKNNFKLDSPGPYMARVVNNIDPEKMGALEVELLRTVGNTSSTEQQLFTVRYCSPFYGVTDVFHNTPNTNYDYNETQKSYGFWMVPPDTGTIVMVMFVEGWAGEGYWFGCIPDKNMNYMVPGIAGSTSLGNTTRIQDVDGWTGTRAQAGRGGGDRVNPGGGEVDISTVFQNADILPVAEYNKVPFREGETFNEDVDANIKPVHPIAYNILEQGLIRDPVRGVHTSSSRRETPSNVFGISTPGPIDKRPGAQKGQVGKRDKVVTKFVSRLGGTTLVMDDGNEKRLRKYRPYEGPMEYADLEKNEDGGIVDLPEDEGFRIRTRTGHQILMSNTEDLIYINNSRGTAWIELTSNGKIDIFAQDSVSIHTENDFNFTADRDINFTAGGSIQMNAIANFMRTAGGDSHELVGGEKKTEVAEAIETKSQNRGIYITAAEDISLDAITRDIAIRAGDKLVQEASLVSTTGKNGIIRLTDADIEDRAIGQLLTVAHTIQQSATDGSVHIAAKGPVTFKTDSSFYHEFTGDFFIKAANIAFDADKIDLNSGVATSALQKLNNYEVPSLSDGLQEASVWPQTSQRNYSSPAVANGADSSAGAPITAIIESPVTGRVPQHEPWLQHENLNPQIYTPEYTKAGLKQYDSYGPHLLDRPPPTGYEDDPLDDGGGGGAAEQDEYGEGDNDNDEASAPGGVSGITNNAQRAMEYFVNTGGLTPAQAAAFVGNFQQESGPGRNYPCDGGAPCPQAFNPGEGAGGIAQWRLARRAKYKQVFGVNPEDDTIDNQLKYVLLEIGYNKVKSGAGFHPFTKIWKDKMKPATDESETNVRDLTKLVMKKYEVSSSELGKRESNALRVWRQYNSGSDPSDNQLGQPDASSGAGRSKTTGDGLDGRSRPTVAAGERPPATPGGGGDLPLGAPPAASGVSSGGRVDNRPNPGAKRPKPVNAKLVGIIERAAADAGIPENWVIDIFSGKCDSCSSFRHRSGMAADIVILKGPKQYVTDKAILKKFIYFLVIRGIKGIGHGPGYMDTRAGYPYPVGSPFHVDTLGVGGSIASWGSSRKKNTRQRWVWETMELADKNRRINKGNK